MRVIATPIKAKDLNPGDLFSAHGQEAWDTLSLNRLAVGQKVYVRTDAPTPPDQADDLVYRITFEDVPEAPMGASQWLAHGKKFGYVDYFKKHGAD